jgi:thiamine biosynthesis lipoprotein
MRRQIPKSKFQINIVDIVWFLSLLMILSACTYEKERVFKKSAIMMDTVITISVVSRSEGHAERAINTAFSEIKRLEGLFDFYSPDSEVSLINRNAGVSRVKVSPDMVIVLDKASFVSEKTEGAFDVTTGCLLELYDFSQSKKPQKSALEKCLSLVDYRAVKINRKNSTVFLEKKGMRIDLGGIVKGYTADQTVEALKSAGIDSGIVSIAGDIKTFGLKPNGTPWKVGIKDPRAEGQDDIIAALDLKDLAISTSGDYERYFMLDGARYHHLLSPKTGYPVHTCQSASIITGEGVLADAFATGVFILGPQEGMEVIEKLGLDGFIIDKEGHVHVTSNIREKIEFEGTFKGHNES